MYSVNYNYLNCVLSLLLYGIFILFNYAFLDQYCSPVYFRDICKGNVLNAMFAFLPVSAVIWAFSYYIKDMVVGWKMKRYVLWMFLCSGLVIRDLTLRSASSFGSFHLMNILFGDYILYLILHKVAAANHTTPVAIYAKEEVCMQLYWSIRYWYIHLVLCVVGKACYGICIFAAKTSEWNFL